jgi:hypothetical protein
VDFRLVRRAFVELLVPAASNCGTFTRETGRDYLRLGNQRRKQIESLGIQLGSEDGDAHEITARSGINTVNPMTGVVNPFITALPTGELSALVCGWVP